MGRCVEKLPHICGTADGMQVFISKGEYDAYCYACDTYVPSPYVDGPPPDRVQAKKIKKTKEEINNELAEISTYPTVDLPLRKLSKWSLDCFGVKTALSEQDGHTPIINCFPFRKNGKLLAYKMKLIEPKKMWSIGDIKDAEMFGWDQALASGAKTLFITEGEEDAVALYQALKDKSAGTKWKHLIPAVISLKSGASGAKKDITENLSQIRASFKDVVLVFDRDDAGESATKEVLKILPTAKTVVLPEKDANTCLIKGRSQALCNAVLFKAEVPKNTRLVSASSLYEQAKIPAEMGIPWPWEGVTKLTRGIRFGEVTYLGAGVKQGKSEIVNSLAAHLIVNHNMPCFLAKPEEANNKSIKMVLGKVAATHFHDPNIPFDGEAYDKAAELVGDRMYLLNLYQHLNWDSLRADIMVAVDRGVRFVFIDPITNLTGGINSAEANTHLQDIAHELAAISRDCDIHSFIFCHLKAPDSGLPHERGGKVFSHQFAGSRAMMRSAQLMLGLEGNRDPDLDIEQRNLRKLVILEDREFGNVGTVHLYWDYKTGLFNEIKEE